MSLCGDVLDLNTSRPPGRYLWHLCRTPPQTCFPFITINKIWGVMASVVPYLMHVLFHLRIFLMGGNLWFFPGLYPPYILALFLHGNLCTIITNREDKSQLGASKRPWSSSHVGNGKVFLDCLFLHSSCFLFLLPWHELTFWTAQNIFSCQNK